MEGAHGDASLASLCKPVSAVAGFIEGSDSEGMNSLVASESEAEEAI